SVAKCSRCQFFPQFPRLGNNRGGEETMRGMVGAFLVAALTCGLAASLYAETTVPAGTAVVIRLEQSVSSKDARTGQKVAGVVSKNGVGGGKGIIPKGSRATLSGARVPKS